MPQRHQRSDYRQESREVLVKREQEVNSKFLTKANGGVLRQKEIHSHRAELTAEAITVA